MYVHICVMGHRFNRIYICIHMLMYIHIYTHICIYLYTYMCREKARMIRNQLREKEKEKLKSGSRVAKRSMDVDNITRYTIMYYASSSFMSF
jgi:hypothetical protein